MYRVMRIKVKRQEIYNVEMLEEKFLHLEFYTQWKYPWNMRVAEEIFRPIEAEIICFQKVHC